jgi:uncharacterized protein (DUF983 family)
MQETMAFEHKHPPLPTPWLPALLRGFRGFCPSCGNGRLFPSYIKMAHQCPRCDTPLTPHRADDAPAYFTIFIVGHIIVPLMLLVERSYSPPDWVHMTLWAPLTLVLSLLILPRVKGALIGLQWALNVRRED